MQSPDKTPAPDPKAPPKFTIALPAKIARGIGEMPPGPRDVIMRRIMSGVGERGLKGIEAQRWIEEVAGDALAAWNRQQRAETKEKRLKAARRKPKGRRRRG